MDNTQLDNGLTKLINDRIEALRPKLLDLTRRNSLLSTKFKEPTNSIIRIVDEIPNFLLNTLVSDGLRIVPLPPLEEDPKDELSREFQNALAEARLNDEIYLRGLELINELDANAANLLIQTERSLKDRIRESLNMPLRQTKANLSLIQHALNHGIRPDYELLKEIEQNDEGRHTDRGMQTLLLPDILERRLNALYIKDRIWKEECGINVLHTAFGFLEWQESDSSDPSWAPLVLLPVELEKRRTKAGQGFWVSANEASPEGNQVLAEKLRHDFNIILPEFIEGITIDAYLEQVANQKPKGMTWRVRRWVVIGVFPSARMAMYHDLDTSNRWDFAANTAISSLLGGSNSDNTEMPYGDEYNVDEPEIESKVPILVTDADSSQYSIIIDIADGKNLAVEGPPGTGKSQTIVNTIAAALLNRKKVLFVAEKSAALEVVHSRLEAFGLGFFILPLQATRSSKDQVIASIRERIEMIPCIDPIEIDEHISHLRKIRDELKTYIQLLSSSFGKIGWKVYEIMGKDIAFRSLLKSLPDLLRNLKVPRVQEFPKSRFGEIAVLSKETQEVWKIATESKKFWKGIQIANIDPFRTDEVLRVTRKAATEFTICAQQSKALENLGINSKALRQNLSILKIIIGSLPTNISNDEIKLANKLNTKEIIEEVIHFLECSSKLREEHRQLEKFIKDPLDNELEEVISKVITILRQYDINDLAGYSLSSVISKNGEKINDMKEAISFLDKALATFPSFIQLPIKSIAFACKLVGNLSREALMLRLENLQDPTVQAFLRKAKHQADNLLNERQKLRDKFTTLPNANLVGLSKHTSTLLNAGLFSFLYSDYRKAKKFYLNISTRKKYNRDDAADDLNNLLWWVNKTNEFSSNKYLNDLLGFKFEGIDTNFEPYLEACTYFEEIDENLPGLENKDLRAFLGSTDKSTLISLPQPSSSHPIWLFQVKTAKTLQKQLKDCEKEHEGLKAAISFVSEAKEAFCDPESLSLVDLQELLTRLSPFIYSWKLSYANSSIQGLLGKQFKGPETQEAEIDKSLQLAIQVSTLENEVKNALFYSLEKDKLADLTRIIEELASANEKAQSTFQEITYLVKADLEYWQTDKTYHQIAELMNEAAQDKKGLIAYSRLAGMVEEFSTKGYGSFIGEILDYYNEPCDISEIFNALIVRRLAEEIYKEHGSILNKFDGIKLSSLRNQFAELDRTIIKLSRQRIRALLYTRAKPPQGNGRGKKSTFTEMSLLRNEISKKKRFASMRDITTRAGKALQEIKPCWMMSPLAVAQYIPKRTVTFDLVIIDEASQMPPEDALGALVRAKQVMIVGDTNQLPPTAFFQRILEDEGADDDKIVTEESILEMANAAFKPIRRLRWHYRSRHSGLIAFSNQHIYQNNLIIFPSPNEDDQELGVYYQYVKNGIYSSGTNHEEAKAIIDATIEFMVKYPNLSLGIVTLNQKQRDLLLDEMQYAFERNPLALKYKEEWDQKNDKLEPFFIKNLENVQGDERDVIFIGTVYGREKVGAPVMQRFGPINGIAGKRRLNVLFSRAKKRIVTFSSMTANDIRAEEEINPGVYMLKCWLEYSANKKIESGKLTYNEPDSDFECHVIEQIKSFGCEAIPQIGVSGYFIDIGVRHPAWPHGFILGVECDGAMYHSSRSARDRDRLRQEVLERLGWNIYRIWSTDWFMDPSKETEKLRNEIEQRLIANKEGY